ncbi:Uncharacterized protein QTN25_006817 [Entamoeba marina]
MSEQQQVKYGSLLAHVNSEYKKRKYFDSAEWAHGGNGGKNSSENRETIMSSPPAAYFIHPHKEGVRRSSGLSFLRSRSNSTHSDGGSHQNPTSPAPTTPSQKKNWSKVIMRNSKKTARVLQELRVEATRRDISSKSAEKLTHYLEKLLSLLEQNPYINVQCPDELSQALINLLDSTVDYLLRADTDYNTNSIYEMMYQLIIYPGYQPFNFKTFPPKNPTTTSLLTTYYSSILRTSLLLISSLASAPILEGIKENKDKPRIKKINNISIFSKVFAAVSLRIPTLLQDIFRSITTKPIGFTRNIEEISIWDEFSKFCVQSSQICQKLHSGITGVDGKWLLHFTSRLPFCFWFYTCYLSELIDVLGCASDRYVNVTGYSIYAYLAVHLSHLRISKHFSPETVLMAESMYICTDYPRTLNKMINDRLSRTSIFCIDELSAF